MSALGRLNKTPNGVVIGLAQLQLPTPTTRFECQLLEDCCAATDHGNHLAAIKMVKMQGGVFGSDSNTIALLRTQP
jgi:hypothetical protein